jgi:hypothetical protein
MGDQDLPPYELLAKADASYAPFPPFSAWMECTVDDARWRRFEAMLQNAQDLGKDRSRLTRALEIVRRMAAIETGAIEGLYEVDPGFTFTAATEAIVLAVPTEEPSQLRERLISSQIAGYDYVLDLATKKQPLSETWIRQLHAVICANQETYAVQTSVGQQEQRLPKGQYKTQPNHVRLLDGRIHSYAPVIETPPEMQRLVAELSRPEFEFSHPIIQAAFAHHAFVCIHPFADGNGRVARALASVFPFRSHSMPLLILHGHKVEYLAALRAADAGSRQALVDFLIGRAIDAVQLLTDSLYTADSLDASPSAEAMASLYVTDGGYTYAAVDEAAMRLVQHVVALISERFAGEMAAVKGGFSTSSETIDRPDMPHGYRSPVGRGSNVIHIDASMPAPAGATLRMNLYIEVPKRGGSDDFIVIVGTSAGLRLEVAVADVLPAISTVAALRAQMFSERVVSEAKRSLHEQGREKLKELGYL